MTDNGFRPYDEYIMRAAQENLKLVRQICQYPPEQYLKGFIVIAVDDNGACAVATNAPDYESAEVVIRQALGMIRKDKPRSEHVN